MKKISLALCLFSGALLLASCGSGGTISDGVYTLELGASVLTKEVINQNISKNESYYKRNYTYSASKVSLPSGTTAYTTSYSYGYIITRSNTESKYGIYSIYAGKVLVPAKATTNIYTSSDQYFGFRASFKYEDNKYYHIDGAGNILNSDTKEFSVNNFEYHVITDDNKNQTLYSALTTTKTGASPVTKYFKYDEKGKASSIKEIPSGTDEGYERGDRYTNTGARYDLAKLGIDRYVTYENDVYHIFNRDGSEAASLQLPSGSSYYSSGLSSVSFIVGGKLFYQYSISAAFDATDYTYAYSYAKYKVFTNVFDLATLEDKSIDTKAIYSSATTVKDAEGAPRYAVVTLSELRPGKVLGATRKLLMDENGVFHDDMNVKPNLTNLVELTNGNVFDGDTYSLYDSSLTKIGSCSDLTNISVDPTREYISGRKYINGTGYYAILSNEGKHLIPSLYSSDTYYNMSYGLFNTVKFSNNSGPDAYYDVEGGKELKFDAGESFDNSTGLVTKEAGSTYTVRQYNSTKVLVTINNFEYLNNTYTYNRSAIFGGIYRTMQFETYDSTKDQYEYITYCFRTATFNVTPMS